MSLPSLLRFVYNHGSGQVITRGKKIFFARGVSLLDIDYHIEQVRFKVRNDVYNNFYTVTVSKFLQPEQLSVRCQCPYNLGEICRHEVAALFHLNDLVASGFFQNTQVQYDQKHTTVRMRDINPQLLRLFTNDGMMDEAGIAAAENKCEIIAAKNEKVTARVPDAEDFREVTLLQNEDRYFDTSCSCAEHTYPVCIHKLTLFLQLYNQHGGQYFRGLQNWDEQKNKLLRLYGYSLKDDLEGKFDFVYEGGKPFLRVLDSSIKKVGTPLQAQPVMEETAVAETEETDEKHLGLVIETQTDWYPYCAVELVSGEVNEEASAFTGPIEKLDLQKYINTEVLKPLEQEWVAVARKIHPEELVKYLKKSLPFGDFLGDYQSVLREQLDPELFQPLWEYLLPKYRVLFQKSETSELCFIHESSKPFSSKGLRPVVLSHSLPVPLLKAQKKGAKYEVVLYWKIEEEEIPFREVKMINAAILEYQGRLYCLSSVAEIAISESFLPVGKVELPAKEWQAFLEQKLVPWRKAVEIEFAPDLMEVLPEVPVQFRLYMYEQGESLHLKPAFLYKGTEARMGDPVQLIQAVKGKVSLIERDTVRETEFCNMLQALHENMLYSMREKQFYIHSKNVLKQGWYHRFSEQMQEWDVELLGYDNLKSLRINRHKAETKVHISSNIDWFETTVDIAFGDQLVTIADVKKALARKENFVKLADGSIGILPEEMINKFTLLTKVGEIDGSKLKVKKIHFSVLDELLSEVDEEALQQELEEKKERLDRIIGNDYSNIQAPENLKAILRPYQVVGFQWLMFLKEAGWGGILADDMGLGKTVQTLSWLAHYKNEHPKAKFLVVCPTTLTYNWEKEIHKFIPDFNALIHHGPKRATAAKSFEQVDVIITSYGTIRSDIKMFAEIEFDYVVLDESQAIKNPKSLATKAAGLLNAKYRLALSGTPIQNNTFDLYAQMNFLNPGMLGSRDFFMNEFAMPIDKFQEKDAKEQLKKLVYPFMLRRTKDQVAKDLPAKTETVLYCEMGKEQRKIYEAYRSNYQSRILGMIDEQGINKSQFHILQGLTKLRQICDSPAIINDAEQFENHSVKLEELVRELTENTGEHKALVFSQFLGMLALIRSELTAKGIPFVYFDGSTNNADREKAIQEFQENEACKVFLISLKAGGVGLNLTAADYVYIVDPWWNPAVEQQAIDRTHRIGQTKSVFAYRFICKDSIEEKMLLLQERKRLLAEDLISDDSAIMKRLTREDIAYLFS
ncbi:MAG: DEAD/DEAH box helicase [Chitinophagaceae bacterium]|nr:DEAD/DEAH box helicase [Chitinophagaceae bacterium]